MGSRWLRLGSVLFAMALVLAACGGDDTGEASGEGAEPAVEEEAPTEEPAAPEIASGPFFLDLRTGESAPLPESLAGGFSYPVSPDGTRLVYNAGVMTVANIDGTDARTLDVPEGFGGYSPQWSPDGTKLVYQMRGSGPGDFGNLFVQDLATGETTQLTDLGRSVAYWWFMSARFNPDGRNVIFHMPRRSGVVTKWDVWSVPVTGGEPTLLLRNAAFGNSFPDGEGIAFVSKMTEDFTGLSISIEDAQGSRRTLVEANDSIWYPTMSPDGTRIAYADGGSIYVVEVATGESSPVAEGGTAEWLGNDTLIVTPE